MTVVAIAQVLVCAEDFERMLAEFFANLSHQSTKEGVRLLTSYNTIVLTLSLGISFSVGIIK